MADPFLAEIRIFPFNFAPRGWAFCDGAILSINQNQALFSLLGTTYGGDGRTTFALPDLRSRMPLHAGSGPALTTRSLGETGGAESVALTVPQLAAHSHALSASTAPGNRQSPASAYLATDATGSIINYSTTSNAQMASAAIGTTGGNQPHENMPPFLALSFCIALQGIFPSRN